MGRCYTTQNLYVDLCLVLLNEPASQFYVLCVPCESKRRTLHIPNLKDTILNKDYKENKIMSKFLLMH